MPLSIGIVGLPNVGKSTLFQTITKKQVNIANYPFCTIDPNVGVVAVPDERVDKLAELEKSAKKIYTTIEFYDIAGLVKGANAGEGLGNQFLSHIREVSAIVEVVRCFPADEIIHVENSVEPVRDLEIVNMELILKDLETVDKRIKSAESEAKTGKKEAVKELEMLQNAKATLGKGELLQAFKNEPVIKNLSLLTAKAMFYFINGKEEDMPQTLKDKITALGSSYIVANLSDASLSLSSLIREAYRVLNLISFFTTGEDETRAWTIERGWKAPQAAGVIHTDFEKKFIRAEVIDCDKLLEAGGLTAAKQKGWLRVEGKEYEVKDGDVMEIRHG